jgi:hypothetical protein
MAWDFPVTPTTGDLFELPSGKTYQWDGEAWQLRGNYSVVFTNDVPPTNPVEDQLWWKSNTGELFVYYVDVDSAQWVQISGGGGGSGIREAPLDGQTYARTQEAWIPVVVASDTAPASPVDNQFWYESNTGNFYIYFNDGTSSQWVQINR